jgi:hypothetical protein
MQWVGGLLGAFGLSKFTQAKEPAKEGKIYKYSQFLRRCDQATMDEFKGIICIDDTGNAHKVPVIWATDERAASCFEHEKFDVELPCTQIRLPLINVYRGDLFLNEKINTHYHLTAHGLFEEDMNQILEQIMVKFHPTFKNAVGEYTLVGIINNYYPGEREIPQKDAKMRILKHQLDLVVAMEGRP